MRSEIPLFTRRPLRQAAEDSKFQTFLLVTFAQLSNAQAKRLKTSSCMGLAQNNGEEVNGLSGEDCQKITYRRANRHTEIFFPA